MGKYPLTYLIRRKISLRNIHEINTKFFNAYGVHNTVI